VPARIVVDGREKSSGIPDLLRKAGAVIDFAQLKVGDYVVSPEIAVERKTVHDLLSSIYDGRLFLQCSDLVKHYQKPLIVVQGNLAYDALATVVTEFRIPIIHTPSADQTVQFLVTLVNKSLREGKATGPLLRKIKKENPIKIQQLSVLSSVPGVGEKLAVRMLEKFHTPNRALNASVAELATIPGFGPARAVRVRKILDSGNNAKEILQKTLFEQD